MFLHVYWLWLRHHCNYHFSAISKLINKKKTNSICHIYLVGGWATSLKNMKVSWDDDIPNICKNKKWQPNHQPVILIELLPMNRPRNLFLLVSSTMNSRCKRLMQICDIYQHPSSNICNICQHPSSISNIISTHPLESLPISKTPTKNKKI